MAKLSIKFMDYRNNDGGLKVAVCPYDSSKIVINSYRGDEVNSVVLDRQTSVKFSKALKTSISELTFDSDGVLDLYDRFINIGFSEVAFKTIKNYSRETLLELIVELENAKGVTNGTR
jgi:hypothetical protein